MKYQICNENLKVEVNSLGAMMTSVQTPDGTEYLWQADPAVWKGQAPNLFPYVGRMPGGRYTYQGQEYIMDRHGFARDMEFVCQQVRADYLVCSLEDNGKTRQAYPFGFQFEIHYELDGSRIKIYYIVKNKEGKTMYFGLGGHPGFNVPLTDDEKFEDYYFLFPPTAEMERVELTAAGYLTGATNPYIPEEGNRISLQHDLFDQDAIVLTGTQGEVVLCSAERGPVLHVKYPGMPYVGLWHMAGVDAPYVCVEPWVSLPSGDNVVEAFEEKADLVALEPYGVYTNLWEITIL